ncbi:hypothetical protein DM860_011547 [Cuscuta australis]|uniref:Protein ATEB1 homolog 2 n=1 Tax=Cuscuta australis TaxID=267555 RepID=A0A328D3R6_9ASTE|nr:hypothetical protein DM860_011547 [Cuscuta australis]
MASNIGIMDSAYFVGRNEILSWINSRLHLNLSRIEEAASGAVQCQMMDMTYPGIVPMHKVNFDAKTEYDMIQNYKVLQDVFNKLKIDKKRIQCVVVASSLDDPIIHIEVNRLVKGRPLDNLEFLQWLKRYCDSINGGITNENYNPVERRCRGGRERCTKVSQRNTKSLQTNNSHSTSSGDGVASTKILESKQAKPHLGTTAAEVEALSKEVTELKLSIDLLEKERDFYFSKLRDVEILCQAPDIENVPMAVAIKKILYAVDEKESALAEAKEILNQATDDADEAEPEYHEEEEEE